MSTHAIAPRVTSSFTAPNGNRVVNLSYQARSYTVRQTPKLVTTVWLGTDRITKKDYPGAFYDLVQAAFAEWETPAPVETSVAEDSYTVRRADGTVTVSSRSADAARAAAQIPAGEVLPYRLEQTDSGTTWLVHDRQSPTLWGTVFRVQESMRPGMVQWTRWVAHGPDGSRVGHTDSLPGAARLLVPLSEQAQETLAARAEDRITGRVNRAIANR